MAARAPEPAPSTPDAESGPLDAELARFIDHLAIEKQSSAHTLDAYRRDLAALRHWAAAQGIARWGDVDGLALRGFIADEHARGLAPPSVQRRLSACRALFRWLLKHGVIANDPSAGLRGPKAPRKLPQVLDADEMGQLVEVPDSGALGLRDRAMMELFYSSGLRVSELCALRWADLDLAGGEVRVLGKGRKTRIVPVGRHAREALAAWAASESASVPLDVTGLPATARIAGADRPTDVTVPDPPPPPPPPAGPWTPTHRARTPAGVSRADHGDWTTVTVLTLTARPPSGGTSARPTRPRTPGRPSR